MEEGLEIAHLFKVSEEVYNGFQHIFKDKNELHVDEFYAKEKGFEGKVMYGNILNGFVSYFIGELLPQRNVVIQKQEIQFHKPIYLGDEVKFDAKLAEVYYSVNSYLFKYKFRTYRGIVAKGKVQIGLI